MVHTIHEDDDFIYLGSRSQNDNSEKYDDFSIGESLPAKTCARSIGVKVINWNEPYYFPYPILIVAIDSENFYKQR